MLDTYIIVTLSWQIHPLIPYSVFSFVIVLKSFLSNASLAFFLPFAWSIFFNPFTFSLCVLQTKWVSWRPLYSRILLFWKSIQPIFWLEFNPFIFNYWYERTFYCQFANCLLSYTSFVPLVLFCKLCALFFVVTCSESFLIFLCASPIGIFFMVTSYSSNNLFSNNF